MPHIFTFNSFKNKSLRVRTYADKHTPVVVCAPTAERDRPFSVSVRIGINEKHPNTIKHHFCFVQLWDLETLVGEVRFDHRSLGTEPQHVEAHFWFVPTRSLRLTAMAYCNLHGLWQSEEVFVHAPH